MQDCSPCRFKLTGQGTKQSNMTFFIWWVYEWRKEEIATRVNTGKVKKLELALRLRFCVIASEGQHRGFRCWHRDLKFEERSRKMRLQHRVRNVEVTAMQKCLQRGIKIQMQLLHSKPIIKGSTPLLAFERTHLPK